MKRHIRTLGVLWFLLLILGLSACTYQGSVPDADVKNNGISNEVPNDGTKDNTIPDTEAKGTEVPNALVEKDPKAEMKVHYIDVGQADCILIQLADGRNVLIDGGNRGDAAIIDDYLQSQNVKNIDYLIATHPHEDHIGSLPYIVKNYHVAAAYMPKVTANTKVFEDLLTEIKAKGLKINTASAGVKLIDSEDVQLTILAPNETAYEELNEYSVVAKLVYGNTSFLFTGDAEAISEGEILNRKFDLDADVLKVGHHGGRTSTTAAFLRKVSPQYAIISVGADNDYGHPHQETLDKLQEAGIQIYRTDQQGTIVAASDGNKIVINKSPAKSIVAPTSNKPTETLNLYIGNRNSKVFHLTSCRALPKAENQVKLQGRETAVNSGYTPCNICKP